MADFSSAAPVEEQKTEFVHDQSTRPPRPGMSYKEHTHDWLILIVGLVFAAGFVALAFQTRDSWESHRDWVVPVVVPPLVIGGLAAAYLVIRNEWEPAAPGIFLILVSVGLMAANLGLEQEENPSATARDLLAAFGGVTLGLSVAAFFIAMIWVEVRRPTQAPAPEI